MQLSLRISYDVCVDWRVCQFLPVCESWCVVGRVRSRPDIIATCLTHFPSKNSRMVNIVEI